MPSLQGPALCLLFFLSLRSKGVDGLLVTTNPFYEGRRDDIVAAGQGWQWSERKFWPASFWDRDIKSVQCDRHKAVYADEIGQFGGTVQAELLYSGAIGQFR